MSSRNLHPCLLSFLILSTATSTLEAQTAGQNETYVQAAPLVIVVPSGVTNHRVGPPLGGRTVGLAVAAGTFSGPLWGIEAEFVLGGTISAPQRFSYQWREDYTAQSRDMLLTFNVRWRRAQTLELTAGGGFAISTLGARSIVRTDLFPPRTSAEVDRVGTEWQRTLGGGIDIRLPVNRRYEIVPMFRLRWIERPADDVGTYLGVASIVGQVGAAVRFKL